MYYTKLFCYYTQQHAANCKVKLQLGRNDHGITAELPFQNRPRPGVEDTRRYSVMQH